MTRLLYVFRPEPSLSVTLETAEAMELEAIGCPLFDVEAVGWQLPDPDMYDGLLVGSTNVFRNAGPQLEKLVKLPVYAVGEATAEGAREKGFRVARTGTGGLQGVLDAVERNDMRFLRLAGESMVELSPPAGTSIDTEVVYRTEPLEITPEVALPLKTRGGVVLLHSGEAARRLLAECERLKVDRTTLTLAVIGPRVADIAGAGWESVHIAQQPRDAELLELAADLCQVDDGGPAR